MNRTIDFARKNIENNLTLDQLAEVSNFSKFHFHRLFTGIVGITPHDFLTQLKVERASFILCNNFEISITELAYKLGFSTVSSFSKTFKKVKKMAPLAWREQLKNSNIRQLTRNIEHLPKMNEDYLAAILSKKESHMKASNFNIEVKDLKEVNVIYVRDLSIHVHDSIKFGSMFEKLISWATARDLVHFPNTKAFTVYRSMPNKEGMVQADVCLSVPSNIEGEGIIGKTVIEGGKYAVLYKEGSLDECFAAWDYFYEEWFPNSDYQPDERGVFLNHLNNAKTHPKGLHVFEMCISVKPL